MRILPIGCMEKSRARLQANCAKYDVFETRSWGEYAIVMYVADQKDSDFLHQRGLYDISN